MTSIEKIDEENLKDALKFLASAETKHQDPEIFNYLTIGTGLAGNRYEGIIIRNSYQIIGSIIYKTNGKRAEIKNVLVNNEYRGNGVGSQLINETVGECGDLQEIVLTARSDEAREFFKKQGFTINGLDESVDNGKTVYLMIKRIN